MLAARLHRSPILRIALILGFLSPSLLSGPPTGVAARTLDAPIPVCHVTDGVFSLCPDGRAEWSDVTPTGFAQTNSFLYAAQADLDPVRHTPTSPVDTFMLMYDECGRTTPLGPNEYVLVSFKTVEVEAGKEKLESYILHLFPDGKIIFVENGVPDSAGRASEIE